MLEAGSGIRGTEQAERLVPGEPFLKLEISLKLTVLAFPLMVSINKIFVV